MPEKISKFDENYEPTFQIRSASATHKKHEKKKKSNQGTCYSNCSKRIIERNIFQKLEKWKSEKKDVWWVQEWKVKDDRSFLTRNKTVEQYL